MEGCAIKELNEDGTFELIEKIELQTKFTF